MPEKYTDSDAIPAIYPDYVDVTVPANIAPLHFHIEAEASDYVTRFTVGSESWTEGGQDVCLSFDDWHEIVAKAIAHNGDIDVEVFTATGDGQWTRHKPFAFHVSSDSIDPYISYRLISPSYVTYEDLTINQRNLETYDETLIYGNMINGDEHNGQCINCHHTQGGNPQRALFHVRQYLGGTVINYDGNVSKIDLKTDQTLSAGVYPAWHPTEPWVVFSTNLTSQTFHTRDIKKIEVQDAKSNLIFYDIKSNEVTPITSDSTDLECFPTWSPDGKYIYFVSAHWECLDSISQDLELIRYSRDVQYNLYRMPFDAETRTFGERELIYDAVARNRSVTFPRISPDGRFLMLTQGQSGVFHIWHNDADLLLIELDKVQPVEPVTHPVISHQSIRDMVGTLISDARVNELSDSLRDVKADKSPLPEGFRLISELNSPDVESYHSWSHTGQWIVFSTRRVDGNFTRPFIAHHDGNGHFTKPFELPQDNPQYHREFMRSYNIPEFMLGPVTIKPQEFAEIVRKNAKKANLK
ncbi:MAG: PD40 domain-containing protein [Bacteroidaceae bacterium]|nr:PD40 domain-containing protein [Bacteroidaceae bacterium]